MNDDLGTPQTTQDPPPPPPEPQSAGGEPVPAPTDASPFSQPTMDYSLREEAPFSRPDMEAVSKGVTPPAVPSSNDEQ
jgi:hypothetical protein